MVIDELSVASERCSDVEAVALGLCRVLVVEDPRHCANRLCVHGGGVEEPVADLGAVVAGRSSGAERERRDVEPGHDVEKFAASTR